MRGEPGRLRQKGLEILERVHGDIGAHRREAPIARRISGRLDHQCLDRIGCGETRDLPRECPELRRLRQSESALTRVPTRRKNWRISYDRSG
jgi:hypothetical protein